MIDLIDKNEKEKVVNIKGAFLDSEMFDYQEVDIARHLMKTSFCENELELEQVKRQLKH